MELLKVGETTIKNELVQIVNARDLHIKLWSKTQFADWIKNRIEKYDFIENEDYILVSEKNETNNWYKKDYILKIDIAKEIAMVENNNKWKEIRKYFIQIEKDFNKPLSEIEMARKYLANLENIEKLKIENKELEKTKAYISDKKTATALNTASQKVKENKKLTHKIEELETIIDESTKYYTVRRVEKEKGSKYNWRLLKSIWEELWYEVKKVPDPLYWQVNTYHKNVWLKAYNIELN